LSFILKLSKYFYIFAIAIVLFSTLTVYLIRHQNNLTVSEYDIYSAKIENEVRAVVLVDLHGKDYGNNNEKLLDIIKSNQPDVIFMVGDMITSAKDLYNEQIFFTALTDISPVYYSFGNKELEIDGYSNLISDILEMDINLIEDDVDEIEINGNKISVCGLSSFSLTRQSINEFDGSILEEHNDSENFKLLLCHYPEYYIWFFEGSSEYKYDLMLAGHTHGGLFNLPFVGRVYAPNQRKEEKYIYGSYPFLKSGPMIISGGLANPDEGFRVNNPPEITIVNIKPVSFDVH